MGETAVIAVFIGLVIPCGILIWKMVIDEFNNK